MQLADNGREGEQTTPIGRLLEPRRPFHHPLNPLQIVHAAQDWTGLQDTLLLLSKRRSQLRQVITAIVRQVMGYVDDTPDLQTKTALIKTLQDLTEGKVSDWIGCEPDGVSRAGWGMRRDPLACSNLWSGCSGWDAPTAPHSGLSTHAQIARDPLSTDTSPIPLTPHE